MQFRALGNTGLKVSSIGFGASSLGGAFGEIDEAEGIRAVHTSIELGVNFIDVSPYYGLTKAETVLGKAIKGIPREKYFLATKVGRYGPVIKDFDFSAKRVTASVDESLRRMGVEHVDLIQAHDIEFGDLNQIVEETIPALRQVQKSGKTRFVGISGLPLRALRHVVERVEVDTVLSYCHHELNDTALLELIPLLKSRGIGIISASPLGMGLLSSRGAPSWHPAPAAVKEACARALAHCKSRGASIEKLAIQFAIANADIATTLVGTASPRDVEENVRCLDEPMDRALLGEVSEILRPIHNVSWPSGRPENN